MGRFFYDFNFYYLYLIAIKRLTPKKKTFQIPSGNLHYYVGIKCIHTKTTAKWQ